MKHTLLFALALPLLGQDTTTILPGESTTYLPGSIILPSDTLIRTARFCRTINGVSNCLEIHADGKIVQPDTTRMSYREIVQWIIDSLKEQSK